VDGDERSAGAGRCGEAVSGAAGRRSRGRLGAGAGRRVTGGTAASVRQHGGG
jgi:hypothetical protein